MFSHAGRRAWSLVSLDRRLGIGQSPSQWPDLWRSGFVSLARGFSPTGWFPNHSINGGYLFQSRAEERRSNCHSPQTYLCFPKTLEKNRRHSANLAKLDPDNSGSWRHSPRLVGGVLSRDTMTLPLNLPRMPIARIIESFQQSEFPAFPANLETSQQSFQNRR